MDKTITIDKEKFLEYLESDLNDLNFMTHEDSENFFEEIIKSLELSKIK